MRAATYMRQAARAGMPALAARVSDIVDAVDRGDIKEAERLRRELERECAENGLEKTAATVRHLDLRGDPK